MGGLGVVYIAYGAKARAEAAQSLATLRRWCDLPVTLAGDGNVGDLEPVAFEERGAPGRWAKVNLDRLTPYDYTLFLDADTRIHGRLDVGFTLLARGYALVCVPSKPQHNEVLRHLQPDERARTLAELPLDPLQLNTGVLWFSQDAAPLFEAWRSEWLRYQDKDQGALLRALYRRPVPVALLGAPFNDRGGAVVDHHFGACG